MRTLGVLALGAILGAMGVAGWVLANSIPDIGRYLRMRRM